MRQFSQDVARRFIDLRRGRKFEFQTRAWHRVPTVPESNITKSIVENAALHFLAVDVTPEALLSVYSRSTYAEQTQGVRESTSRRSENSRPG